MHVRDQVHVLTTSLPRTDIDGPALAAAALLPQCYMFTCVVVDLLRACIVPMIDLQTFSPLNHKYTLTHMRICEYKVAAGREACMHDRSCMRAPSFFRSC